MWGMNQKRLTAIKGSMNHAKTLFSTEIFAGAIVSVVQYLAPLRYSLRIKPIWAFVTKHYCNNSKKKNIS
jgi:hypothetical protein